MQKVVMKGGYSYTTATEIAMALVDRGFSVSAEKNGNDWTIAGLRTIDPELDRIANSVLERAGIVAPASSQA
jgi:glycine cleavage system aminomethyltransferase T